jgi:hypothetical protein
MEFERLEQRARLKAAREERERNGSLCDRCIVSMGVGFEKRKKIPAAGENSRAFSEIRVEPETEGESEQAGRLAPGETMGSWRSKSSRAAC